MKEKGSHRPEAPGNAACRTENEKPPYFLGNTRVFTCFEGRSDSGKVGPYRDIEPFAGPFLGPVEPVFLEAERLVRRVA